MSERISGSLESAELADKHLALLHCMCSLMFARSDRHPEGPCDAHAGCPALECWRTKAQGMDSCTILGTSQVIATQVGHWPWNYEIKSRAHYLLCEQASPGEPQRDWGAGGGQGPGLHGVWTATRPRGPLPGALHAALSAWGAQQLHLPSNLQGRLLCFAWSLGRLCGLLGLVLQW